MKVELSRLVPGLPWQKTELLSVRFVHPWLWSIRAYCTAPLLMLHRTLCVFCNQPVRWPEQKGWRPWINVPKLVLVVGSSSWLQQTFIRAGCRRLAATSSSTAYLPPPWYIFLSPHFLPILTTFFDQPFTISLFTSTLWHIIHVLITVAIVDIATIFIYSSFFTSVIFVNDM